MKAITTSFMTFFITIGTQNGFTKCDKRALHRKAMNYKVESGHLFYYHKSGQTWKQVSRSSIERIRILEAGHSLPEGKLLCPYEVQ